MSDNFLEYLQKNGIEAFDKMIQDMANRANAARAQYEADQKKKEAAEKEAKVREANRETVIKQMGRLLKFYFGDALTANPEDIARATLKSVEETLTEMKIVDEPKWKSKMEVIKDEDTPDGHVKVMRANLSDLSDEELREFWNGVHNTFFNVD